MAIKGLPADHHPLSFFRVLDHNLTPVPGKETPRPYVINSSVGIVQKAVQLDSGGVADGLQPKPHIWTSDREIEDAESFFAMMGLEPARAIGLHLTAGSGNVFHRMWRRESFIEVVKHFLEQHYQVVMMTGSTAFPLPRKENNPSWEDHLDFFATLKGRFPEHSDQIALFYGDVLVNAEIIRKCAVFLSGETGPAHLATAVGTPKVTIAATDFQAANWLFTGEGDFGYISQHDKHSRIIGPTVEEVVGGIETILRRKTKTMPVASE
jgi:ADP-heptose:LPS heptosyltransferase